MLAKYGFVEQAPGGEGREKPWRVTSTEHSLQLSDLDDESALAGEAAAEAVIDREAELLKQRIRQRELEPEEWRRISAGTFSSVTFLTREELIRVREEIQAVVETHRDRLADPAKRPEGAREVRLFAAVTVAPPRPDNE